MNLSELHDAVKNHPYRLSGDKKYLQNYKELLYKLNDSFYESVRYHKVLKNVASYLCHDFACAIRNFDYSKVHKEQYLLLIERCIQTIHEYIDTGFINYFYTYYSGSNIPAGLNRDIKWVYDEDSKVYYRPIYPLENLNRAIENLKQKFNESTRTIDMNYYMNQITYYEKYKKENY